MKKLEKLRKLVFGLIGLVFLLVGLLLCLPERSATPDGAVMGSVAMMFAAFKDGIWLIVGAVMVGNVGEHVAGALRKPEGSP